MEIYNMTEKSPVKIREFQLKYMSRQFEIEKFLDGDTAFRESPKVYSQQFQLLNLRNIDVQNVFSANLHN